MSMCSVLLGLIMLFRHMPVRGADNDCISPPVITRVQSRILIRCPGNFVFDPIRNLHKDTPIIVLGGHTHIRDCGK